MSPAGAPEGPGAKPVEKEQKEAVIARVLKNVEAGEVRIKEIRGRMDGIADLPVKKKLAIINGLGSISEYLENVFFNQRLRLEELSKDDGKIEGAMKNMDDMISNTRKMKEICSSFTEDYEKSDKSDYISGRLVDSRINEVKGCLDGILKAHSGLKTQAEKLVDKPFWQKILGTFGI